MKILTKGIHDIEPYANNPRLNDDAVEYVANSIAEFGWQQPIVIDCHGVIIAGHTRYKAALELGMEEVPCVVADDLTDEQVAAYRLADNKVAEMASWNEDLLGKELAQIVNIDMELMGFFEDEELGSELEDNRYTDNIFIPQYEITGDCPDISELVDTEKTSELIKEIHTTNIPDEVKNFLIYAAHRHSVFNYRNIAEYYAHADENVQRLFEKSALVIIDVNDAIANGYARLTSSIEDIMEE